MSVAVFCSRMALVVVVCLVIMSYIWPVWIICAFAKDEICFNVADCGITVGIALLVIDGVFLEPKRSKKVEAQ